jgi:ABC-type multidrug transport system permease subunit
MTAVTVPARKDRASGEDPAVGADQGRRGGRALGLATFGAMLAREFRVMRRHGLTVLLRVMLQPLLTVFVFAFVLPNLGGSQPNPRGPEFATILVPGMVATATMMTGMMSVIFPLMMELGWAKEIADRLLAPLPVWGIALQKIVSGALQALLAGAAVFPIALLVHAPGHAPQVHVTNWPMLVLILLLASVLAPSIGLLLGTVGNPEKTNQMFSFVLMPAAMLGCVYYPWQALHAIPWLQVAVLANPIVYASEALRSVLTPDVPHMSPWVFLPVLAGGTLVIGYLSTRTFTRRVID